MRLLYIVHDMTTWPSLARDLNSKLAFWVWKFFRNSILSKLEFRISDSSRSILLETIHSDWIILILGSAICKSVSRDLENVKIAAEHCTSASTESIWQETQIFYQWKWGSKWIRIISNYFCGRKQCWRTKYSGCIIFQYKNVHAKTFILTVSVSFRISERSP